MTLVRPIYGLIALLLITFAVPLELSVKFGALPRLGPLRLAIAVFLFGLVLRMLLVRRAPFVGPFRAPAPALLLSGLVFLVGWAASIDRLTSGYFLFDQVVLCFFFLLFWSTCRDDLNFDRLKRGLFLGAAIVCAFAFLEAAFGFTLTPSLDLGEAVERLGFKRVRSTFYHPIALGVFLDLVFPFAFADFLTQRSKGRLALGALVVAMVAAQALTVSRIPWIIMVLEGAYVWLMVRPSPSRLATLGLTAVGGLCFALMLAAAGVQSIGRLFGPLFNVAGGTDASSEFYRIALTEAVINKLEGFRWLIGMGPGTFHVADIQAIYNGENHVLTAPDLHYTRVLADTGLIGLAVFLYLLGSVVATCLTAQKVAAETKRPQAIACTAAVLGFIVVNATVSMFYTWPLALVFWLAAARAAALRDRAPSVAVAPIGVRTLWIQRRSGNQPG